MNFTAPAMQCEPADTALIQKVSDAFVVQRTNAVEKYFYYIAWVPNGLNGTTTMFGDDTTYDTPESCLDTMSLDAAHIYIIPNTAVSGPVYLSGSPLATYPRYGYQDLLDCSLYNASYHVVFNSSYPTQTLTVQSVQLLNPVNSTQSTLGWANATADPMAIHAGHDTERICYQSLMYSFGKLLVGTYYDLVGTKTTDKTSWTLTDINWTTRDSAQHGVQELFQNITLSMLSSSALT